MVRLLIEAKDTVPVHVIITLTVQSVECEEWRVEPGQQDRQQQRRAAHHNPGETSAFYLPPGGHQGLQATWPPVFTQVLVPIMEHQMSLPLSALGHKCSHLELGRRLLGALGKEPCREGAYV